MVLGFDHELYSLTTLIKNGNWKQKNVELVEKIRMTQKGPSASLSCDTPLII